MILHIISICCFSFIICKIIFLLVKILEKRELVESDIIKGGLMNDDQGCLNSLILGDQ